MSLNTTSSSQREIHVLIINWNGLSDTIECINSILDSVNCDFKVHVWDNNSQNDEFRELKDKYNTHKNITVYNSNENLGFTEASNLLFQNIMNNGKATLKYLVCLNNDTIVDETFLCNIVNYTEENGYDIVSAQLLNYYSRKLIDNQGHILLSSGEILPNNHGQNHTASKTKDVKKNIGPCAGACLYSSRLIKQIGLFDDFFNTGYEDAEFGLRAYLANFSIGHAHNAIAYHKGGSSIGKVFDEEYAKKQQINILYTVWKCYPTLLLVLSIPFITLRSLLVVIITFIAGRRKISRTVYSAQYEFYTKHFKESIEKRGNITKGSNRNWRLLRMMKSTLIFDLKRIYTILITRNYSAIDKY